MGETRGSSAPKARSRAPAWSCSFCGVSVAWLVLAGCGAVQPALVDSASDPERAAAARPQAAERAPVDSPGHGGRLAAPRPVSLRVARGAQRSPPAAASAAGRGAGVPEAGAPSGAQSAEQPRAEPARPVARVPVELAVPGDPPVWVLHAPPGERRVIVYLHGACGDPRAPASWAQAATSHGTVVSLLGDGQCFGRPRHYWSHDYKGLLRRIERAVAALNEVRGGGLDTDSLTLVGYSQGADVAQQLVALAPQRFPRVLLGSGPKAPSFKLLARSRSVATVGGELEPTWQIEGGVKELQFQHVRARFTRLPGAEHGSYGPQAEQVMGEVLDWLFADLDAAAANASSGEPVPRPRD